MRSPFVWALCLGLPTLLLVLYLGSDRLLSPDVLITALLFAALAGALGFSIGRRREKPKS